MKTVVSAVTACALLVAVAGCGSGTAYSEAPQRPPTAAGPSDNLARAEVPTSRAEERKPLGNGLTLTISAPRAFAPTQPPSPETPRAVGFDMTVQNDGTTSYRPTLLSLTATADGLQIRQVIDATQGYTGAVGTDDVPPGRSVRFSVAFAVPEERVNMLVSAQPDPSSAAVATVFDGQV
ncbi:hypothetical protein [Actinokineospora enzanensis]|uniref:hypothetical protein n=1 Tax=Actinokineospora enzanensis TaxID=155975 RepID=UPI00036667E7|nr:hypothetical protein [Actinokineospora enzanensis]